MNRKELNIDKVVREKLEDFSPAPPPQLWDNIRGQMVTQQKNRRLAYYRWIAAAAVIVMAFLAGWYLSEQPESIQPPVAETEQIVPGIHETETESPLNEIVNPETGVNKPIQTQDNLFAQNLSERENANTFKKKEISGKVIITGERMERTGMRMIPKISIHFNKEVITDWLAEKPATSTNEEYADFDRMLLAENAKSFAGAASNESGWKLGLQVSPGYSSQATRHSENYSRSMTYSDRSGNGNVGGGLSVQYKTGKKWSIESGIYYAQNGQKSNNSPNWIAQNNSGYYSDKNSYFNTPVEVSFTNSSRQMAMNSVAGVVEFSGTPTGAELVANLDQTSDRGNVLLTNGEFSQVFDFIEIPLYARYTLIDSKMDIQLMGGLNAAIVAGNNAYMENQFGLQNVGKTQDISTLNLSGTVGVGLTYPMGKHISFAVEPRLSYYLNSINHNPDVKFRPYRVGFFTGLYYEF